MKQVILSIVAILAFAFTSNAQWHTNKDGSPDKRYSENKIYRDTYTTPSYSNSSYSTPTYKEQTYTNPYSNQQSSFPSYPTNNNGSPDMRYKENKQLYGNSFGGIR